MSYQLGAICLLARRHVLRSFSEGGSLEGEGGTPET